MLAEPKLKSLSELVSDLSQEELIWVNKYLTGLVSSASKEELVKQAVVQQRITIAFGTETGNAQRLATHFATKAKQAGLLVKLVGLDQYRLADLPKEKYFFTVISTQGEGEPPIGAKKFYDFILASAPGLTQLQFAVLALGDTAYPLFCKTGEEVDEQFEKLGGSRLLPLQKCDLDYEATAEKWMVNVLSYLENSTKATNPTIASAVAPAASAKPASRQVYEGTILSKINLNASGSSKRTYHFEIAAEDVNYVTGDSIAITPRNPQEMVTRILSAAKADPEKLVTWKKETYSFEDLLVNKLNISFLSDKSVSQYENIYGNTIPERKISLLALLQKYPVNESQLESIIAHLNPVAPRIYNIASSPLVYPGEVHITVLEEHYLENGEDQEGICTQFLKEKEENDTVSFFIQTNKRFRLPAEDKDVIMIGRGTGIAPFRSFMAERDATGAEGRNWLLFGEEDFTTDFLYQTEWQQYFNTGVLTKVSLAFTNNEEEPFLIQHKLKQQAEEFYAWVQAGAVVYLCGEKDPMGKEVEDTILNIFKEQGNFSDEEAAQYFEQVKKEGRFIKDLY